MYGVNNVGEKVGGGGAYIYIYIPFSQTGLNARTVFGSVVLTDMQATLPPFRCDKIFKMNESFPKYSRDLSSKNLEKPPMA